MNQEFKIGNFDSDSKEITSPTFFTIKTEGSNRQYTSEYVKDKANFFSQVPISSKEAVSFYTVVTNKEIEDTSIASPSGSKPAEGYIEDEIMKLSLSDYSYFLIPVSGLNLNAYIQNIGVSNQDFIAMYVWVGNNEILKGYTQGFIDDLYNELLYKYDADITQVSKDELEKWANNRYGKKTTLSQKLTY